MMDKQTYDLCIIGGGINGCGIARDAAGRGYKVLLLEQGDLASGTSSASTKLIHGGLRYLEQFHFGLVRKALKEREVLMGLAPHIITPMRFILPYAPHLRPLWMIRIGVALYDLLSGKTKLKKSNKTIIKNKFLNKNFKTGIAYSDCWVDDARLVVLNAMDAMAHGAVIRTNTQCCHIEKQTDGWNIQTSDGQSFNAQMVVNAAGPWAEKVMGLSGDIHPKLLRLVKGSHIIIPSLYAESESYILQNKDGRVVFTIPYEGDYTLVGTTDIDIGSNPDALVKIEKSEIDYLKSVIRYYFSKNIKDTDIVHTYSGVRPLVDDGHDGAASQASRDYQFDLQHHDGLPYLTILGGKLTTYRVLAQQAMDIVDKEFHKSPHHWTADKKLPGGDIADDDLPRFIEEQSSDYPFLSKTLIKRYAKTYGTCMNIILEGVGSLEDMGDDLGGGVYGRELDYLRGFEFAVTGDDVLWRRSKLGMHLDKDTQKLIVKYMEERA